MNQSDLPKFTEAAVAFAQAAGGIVMTHFKGDLRIDMKGAGNLVSQADVESETSIIQLINETFPGHAILAEESASNDLPTDCEYLWIVDPLDGTNNFAHGIPHFAISIALYHRGEPVTGVVLNPARNDVYIATKGEGATWNGESIRVDEATDLPDVLVGTGFYYDRGEMMRDTLGSIERLFLKDIHGIRRFGTASLDLCHVASAKYGAFFEYQLAPWDFAAGRLIVEEAGGKVTCCDGRTLPLATSSVLASNGHLHGPMLECISTEAKQVAEGK